MKAFNKYIGIAVALLMCMSVLLLTSCSNLGGILPNGSTVDPDKLSPSHNIDALKLDRNPNRINVMLAVEGSIPGTLSAIDIISINDSGETPAVNILQIPSDTYSVTSGTLSGYFYNSYLSSQNDLGNAERAAEAATAALKGFIQNAFIIPIDYTVYMTRDALGRVIDTVGGVTLDFAYPISVGSHGISAGKNTIDGASAAATLDYTDFSDTFMNEKGMSKHLLTGFIGSLKANINKSILALCVSEMRDQMITDIPTDGGADVFIVRRLMETPTDRINISLLASEPVTLQSGQFSVTCKSGALDQVNNYLGVFKEPLTIEMLDPNALLTDPNESIVSTIYSVSTKDFSQVTVESLRSEKIS